MPSNPEPTQQLTNEDLAVMQGAVERAELFDEETLPLAFSDRKKLLAEVFRLRAENTALAGQLVTARETWRAAEMAWYAGVDLLKDTDLMRGHCAAMRRALGAGGNENLPTLGLDQDGGQANG